MEVAGMEEAGLMIGLGMLVVALIFGVLDIFFGPSDATREAQQRLYEEEVNKAKAAYEAAVQAEMERIRNARRISRNKLST